ncbi:hypothetical protein [Actinomadura oligospora]|uniref:hypothetical protein n=1 Tax=Actinomadura oligospora TaxID=111804 RepID=UPI00047C8984|nr:hypothetical protein [Actinomadura oligospora]
MTGSHQHGADGTKRRGRALPVTAAAVLGVVSLASLAAGGLALAKANGDDGYVGLGDADYRSGHAAVVSDPYDWSKAKPFLFGGAKDVRIRVVPGSGGGPAFVGLVRPADLRAYLSGAGYTTGHKNTGDGVTFTQHPGRPSAAPPVAASVWTARATGAGPLTLRFDAAGQRGDRVLVAMNADGSPNVAGRVETAATEPSLPWIGAGLLAGGVVLLAGSAAAVTVARRRGARPATAPSTEAA